MKARVAIAGIVLIAAASAAIAADSATRDTSWGKAKVSFTDYRADAIVCARQAVALDISHTEAAKILIRASDRIDYASTPAEVADDVAAARPDQQFEEVSDLQHKALSDCLTARGYQRFTLTKAQRKHLTKLKPGSDERRAYLHDLASDPRVLETQAISDNG